MRSSASLEQLISRASEVAKIMKLLGHENRLLLLCGLTEGEQSAGRLVEYCGQSQSSVSQQLGKLRDGGLVITRREGTTVFYALASERVHVLIDTLCNHFEQELGISTGGSTGK